MPGTVMMSRSSGPFILKGDERPAWVSDEKRSALLLLVSGRFRVELPGRSVLLARQGDYVVFHSLSQLVAC